MTQAVVNASPLIYLGRANRLDLLVLAGDEVVIPRAVCEELAWGGPVAWTSILSELGKHQIRIANDVPIPIEIQSWDLGPGESSVIAWARAHPPAVAIIDDRLARRCAAAFNIPVRGTLGLVLTAKTRGVIPAARPVVDELKRLGMYLSDSVIAEALSRVDE